MSPFMLKEWVVGTSIGRAASAARDVIELVRSDKEQIGTIANDQLATYYVTRLCQPGKTFLDIGAHIGSIIAEVERNCPTVRIEAVEAIPAKAKRLSRKFPKARIHCCALSESEGEVSFFINVEKGKSGYSSLAKSGPHLEEIKVPARRLDNLVTADDVDVIKIDVEGAELGVLIGAEALVERCRPTIMFESGPQDLLGYTKQAMYEWFRSHGYALYAPSRLGHGGPPLSQDGFHDSHHYPRRTTNYFAVALERAAEIHERAAKL